MKTIIAGTRDGFKYEDLCAAVNLCGFADAITEVVSGTARGPDLFGEQWARDNNIPIKRFPADWEEHGKAAGHIRNAEMAEYADAAIILWDGQSKGTAGMIKLVEKWDSKYIHLIHFMNAPTPPSMSMYSNAICYRAAMDMYKVWEKSMTDQGIRLR